jgi:uncharacterized protein (TIGR03437 family)
VQQLNLRAQRGRAAMGVAAGGWRSFLLLGAILIANLSEAAPFGRVTALGGQGADLALDEPRGVLYVANFGGRRIDVVSLATGAVTTSMNVAPQPGSLSLSPDGRWLVVTHYGNFTTPNPPQNALTLIDLNSTARQTINLANAPLAVQFGIDGKALVITGREFLLVDPVLGVFETLGSIGQFTINALPRPVGENRPGDIVGAAMGVSGDGRWIYCLTDSYRFRYEVLPRRMQVVGYTSDPPMGPRAVSVNQDGTLQVGGWALRDRAGQNIAQFINPAGLLSVGSHAIDSRRGVIYSQVPQGKDVKLTTLPPPVLSIVASDNLELIESLELPENLAGRGVLSADGSMMYAVSESGVMFLPVGNLELHRRVTATVEDVVFRANSCDRRAQLADLQIVDLSGQATEFSLASDVPGIRFSAVAGVTPATIRLTVDPLAFQSANSVVTATVTITAPDSVRIPATVRLVINLKDPDQRGSVFSVPGKLIDLLADPIRDRFYILRQDRNQVLVFDSTTYQQIGTLRTSQTPWQMAFTMDRRHLMVGHDNAQIASVFDLETLQPVERIAFPGGHYPRSLAATGRGIIAAARVAGPQHKMDRVDFATRRAAEFPTLGPWENNIHENTMLVPAGNGNTAMAVSADGNLYLYNASSDTFSVSRRDTEKLSGAYAASNFDQFMVGNALLNASLVTTRRFNSPTVASTTVSAGFAFAGDTAVRLSAPGVMERIDTTTGLSIRPTRVSEAPLEGSEAAGNVFSRSLVALSSRKALVALTVSGFTVLPWEYDAGTAPPRIDRIVNAADSSSVPSSGALVSILGGNLSPVNIATQEMPLPTALGESCLLVNGMPVPVLYVSAAQINAQMPFSTEGSSTMVLRTPGGVSNNFNFNVSPASPGIFRVSVAGLDAPVPAIYNGRNGLVATGSNPLKRGDSITILATGLGRTNPAVEAGAPAPSQPRAAAEITPVVTLGGIELRVDFAGLQPGATGLYQINAQVSRAVPTGMSVPLEIKQKGAATSVTVRVIE